ncbi:hypothetical protein C0583_02070 [Candidatus Parcubacteria bacterium]|nr:MAG: hypothetical protein C0583_02070 [Candidatus Parcubacteria bacterium]
MSSPKTKEKTTDPKQIMLITVIIFLVALFAFVYLLIIPQIEKIKEKRVTIANTKIEINKNTQEEENLSTQKSKLESIEDQLEQLDKVFINRNKELEFITTLEGVAAKNNVEQNIDLKAFTNNTKEGYVSIPLNITVSGNYYNVISYIQNIESLSYYFNITNLSLNTNSSQVESYSNINASIKANVFINK